MWKIRKRDFTLVLATESEHEQGVTGLFTGKILTLSLESSYDVRSFSVVLVTKRL